MEEEDKKYMWNIKDAIAQCNITRNTKTTACTFVPCAYVLIVHKRKKGLEHLEKGSSLSGIHHYAYDFQFVGVVVLCPRLSTGN